MNAALLALACLILIAATAAAVKWLDQKDPRP